MATDSSREALSSGRGDARTDTSAVLPGNSLEPVNTPSVRRPTGAQEPELRRLRMDGLPVERLTYSKRRAGPEGALTVEVRARVEGSQAVLVRRGLSSEALEKLLGADNARRIVTSRTRGGTIEVPQVLSAPLKPVREGVLDVAPGDFALQQDRGPTSLPSASPEPVRAARQEPIFMSSERPSRLGSQGAPALMPEELNALREQARRARLAFAAMVVGHGRQGAGRDESEEASLQRVDLRWARYRASVETERQAVGDLVGAEVRAQAPDAGGGSAHAMDPRQTPVMTVGIASQWADQDAKDFARLRDPELKVLAAQAISAVMQEQPAYRARLEAKAGSVYREVRDIESSAVREGAVHVTRASASPLDAGPQPPNVTQEEPKQAGDAADLAAGRNSYRRVTEAADALQQEAGQTGHGAASRSSSTGQPEVDPVSQVELDRRAAQALREMALRSDLAERYVQRDNEYRFRGEPTKIAFVDRGAKLTTQLATPSIARSMLDLAEAKGWDSLRVRGDESFRRQVWLEAGLRDVKVLGYEATAEDRDLLQRERAARQINTIEPQIEREPRRDAPRESSSRLPAQSSPKPPTQSRGVVHAPEPQERSAPAERIAAQSAVPPVDRPLTTASTAIPAPRTPPTDASQEAQRRDEDAKHQVLAVLQAALKAQKVDQRTAAGVLRTAEERLDRMQSQGKPLPQVRIYDRAASPEKLVKVQLPREVRERAARGR